MVNDSEILCHLLSARIAEIGKHEGQTVTIRGWLYNLRESGKLLFPHLPRRHRR